MTIPDDDRSAAVEHAVVAALLALPARSDDRRLQRADLDVAKADAWLAATVPGFRDLAGDPPATWQLLADLHDRGQLDVSAAPSRKLVTGVEVHDSAVPAGFTAAVSGKAARAAAEIALLRDFFADRRHLREPQVRRLLRRRRARRLLHDRGEPLLGVLGLPRRLADDRHPADRRRGVAHRPAPAGRMAGRRRGEGAPTRRAGPTCCCGRSTGGCRPATCSSALRGQDTWFYARARRWVRLPTAVVTSRFFGANPSVTLPQVEDALARLAADGRAVAGGRPVARRRQRRPRAAPAAARQRCRGGAGS